MSRTLFRGVETSVFLVRKVLRVAVLSDLWLPLWPGSLLSPEEEKRRLCAELPSLLDKTVKAVNARTARVYCYGYRMYREEVYRSGCTYGCVQGRYIPGRYPGRLYSRGIPREVPELLPSLVRTVDKELPGSLPGFCQNC